MNDPGLFLRDLWYLAAHARALKPGSIERRILLGEPVLLARRRDGHVIENFKVVALRRYGLDWEALRAVNPALVYCSITGYGQSGPNAKRAGYDAAIQAEAGLMSLTGEPA